MKKAKLGTKRVCPNCGTKYYDLERDPIICPSCATPFEVAAKPAVPEKVEETKPAEPEAAAAAEPAAEAESEDDGKTVSLEEADAEAMDSGAVPADLDDDDDGIADDEDSDDTFLSEDDDDDDDVGDIIGDVEKDDT